MGSGRCDSRHWDSERKLSDAERATYWETRAIQYQSELRMADKTLERFALRIANLEKENAEYRLTIAPFLSK